MAEQSSTVATFRALAMLICVILVLVAAVCGTSCPNVVKAIQNGRWPTLADFRGGNDSSSNTLGEAPRYVAPSGAGTAAPNGQPMNGCGAQAPPMATPALPMASPLPTESGQSPVVAANYNAPIPPSQAGAAGQSTSFPQNRELAGGQNRDLTPVPQGSPGPSPLGQGGSPTGRESTGASPSPSGPMSPDDQFTRIHQRLRELGATYYLLESWGDQKHEFRFYCKMSIGGNPHVTQPFWYIDTDPLKAMTQVLQQVEDWRNSGGRTPLSLN
jgi:hypothetical protein